MSVAEAIAACLDRHGAPARLGVAVSGGGDSTALLVAATDLPEVTVAAVTVDHGLRPEARAEAEQVARLCARLGVPHRILHWAGDTAAGNLQQAARRARHALIGAWARQAGLEAVLLGHTLDDQAETVLMRLARGSGVDGLAGMAEVQRHAGIVWLRPFLGLRREALRDYLRGRDLAWCDDPSNADTRFQRVRARKALAALAPLGIEASGLAATAARMARARAALEAQTEAALAAHAEDDRGTVRIARAALTLQPEIRDRFFARLLERMSGAGHPPRLAALQRWIARAEAGAGGPFMGCVLRPQGDVLRLFREYRAVSGHRVRADALWDGRWSAQGPGDGRGLELRALGAAGLRQLSAQARDGLHPHWRETGLPEAALRAMPGVWEGARLIAAPLALWGNGWHIAAGSVVTGRAGSALSH
ncbi:MAG: tRNA(Ile)-lysidine synthase TilS [Rhodobacteraceae bacterium HLUCCA12]|nr:MAG: tRNA(Ile)-lysidine synthase TilS [Rhodobacteraceae bacterium HLUCCA12]